MTLAGFKGGLLVGIIYGLFLSKKGEKFNKATEITFYGIVLGLAFDIFEGISQFDIKQGLIYLLS